MSLKVREPEPEPTRVEGEGFNFSILEGLEVRRCGLGARGVTPVKPGKLKSALLVKDLLSRQHPKPRHIVPGSRSSYWTFTTKANLGHVGCAAPYMYPCRFEIGPNTSTIPRDIGPNGTMPWN